MKYFVGLLLYTCLHSQPKQTRITNLSRVIYNDKMYIFGGYDAIGMRHFNDLHEFDPLTTTWREINTHGQPPCSRRRQACVLVENRLFLFGGTSPICPVRFDEDGLIDHSDMHVLDMNPSLKTLCFLALKEYELDDTLLPDHVRIEYADMFNNSKQVEQFSRLTKNIVPTSNVDSHQFL